MNVLVVAAHPDDETLGCGGTIARHADKDDTVTVLVLGEGGEARGEPYGPLHKCLAEATRELGALLYESEAGEDELLRDNQFDSYPLLGIVQQIERVVADVKPAIVLTHSEHDLNIDHAITARAVATACRSLPGSTVEELGAFYSISSQEYALRAFQPNLFVELSVEQLGRKQAALACYPSELRSLPHPRNGVHVATAAAFWGAMAGVSYAEPFELIRSVWRAGR